MIHLLEESMVLVSKSLILASHSLELVIYYAHLFLSTLIGVDRRLKAFDIVRGCKRLACVCSIGKIGLPLDRISHLLDLLP